MIPTLSLVCRAAEVPPGGKSRDRGGAGAPRAGPHRASGAGAPPPPFGARTSGLLAQGGRLYLDVSICLSLSLSVSLSLYICLSLSLYIYIYIYIMYIFLSLSFSLAGRLLFAGLTSGRRLACRNPQTCAGARHRKRATRVNNYNHTERA